MTVSTPPRPAPGADATRQGTIAGIVLMLAGMAAFPAMDTVSKVLAADHSAVEVTWARYVFHLVPLVLLSGPRRLRQMVATAHPLAQIVRSAALALSALAIIFAFAIMPLADAVAVAFVGPLLIVALGAIVLGEPVGPHRWTAVGVGFVGMLVMVWPSGGVFEAGALLAFVSAVFWAVGLMMTRQVRGDGPWVTLFYTAAVGAGLLTLVVPFFWTWPSLQAWGLMAVMGLIGGLAHTLIINAFLRAPASTLAPYNYTLLIWAVLFGWLAFGDLPAPRAAAGAAIIVAAGLYTWHRERLRG